MKNIFLTTVIILTTTFAFAQQMPVQSQFSNNLYSINPAVAGALAYNPINMSYKQLWTGVDDAPQLSYLSGHIAVKKNLGIGTKIYSLKTGKSTRTGMELTYAYRLALSEENHLSFGVSAFMYQFNLNKSELNFEDNNDPVIYGSADKVIVPDAAFGMFFNGRNYYAGLSAYQLFNRKISMTTEDLEQRQVRHFNFNAGYLLNINADYSIQADLLLKYSAASAFQAEITAKCFVMQTAWAGVSYQSGDALSLMVGIGQERFALGYAYDLPLNDIKKQTLGSHEIMLIYTLPGNKWQRRTFIPEGSGSQSKM